MSWQCREIPDVIITQKEVHRNQEREQKMNRKKTKSPSRKGNNNKQELVNTIQ